MKKSSGRFVRPTLNRLTGQSSNLSAGTTTGFKNLSSNRSYTTTKKFEDLSKSSTQESERRVEAAQKANESYDSKRDVMEALHRRMNVKTGAPVDATLYRADDFPQHDVSPNAFKTPKSSVNKQNQLVPVHQGDGGATAIEHVEGKNENKAKSPFTSTFSTRTPTPMLDTLETWGKKTLEIDGRKTGSVLTPMEVQSEIRRGTTGTWFDIARETKNNQTVDWHWENDSMFDTEEKRNAVRPLLERAGINPSARQYSKAERAVIFNVALDEHLIEGATQPGAVTNIRPTKEVRAELLKGNAPVQSDLEGLRGEKSAGGANTGSQWLANRIQDASDKRD